MLPRLRSIGKVLWPATVSNIAGACVEGPTESDVFLPTCPQKDKKER